MARKPDKEELTQRHMDLAASVRDVLERSAAALATAGCAATLDAPEPVRGRWDRGRIEQVVA